MRRVKRRSLQGVGEIGDIRKNWGASKPAPTMNFVHLREVGRLAGRHRWQASSHNEFCTPAGDWSAVRPPSRAGQLTQ
ncbi:hypothetical protein EMIT0P294_110197 [Pseudomonas sp. IT-P294]